MEITPRPVFWQADFVSPSTWAPTDGPRPAYLLRAEFEVPPTAVSVTVFVTAHGIYDVEVDGERATRAELAPGWSSYAHRLRYQTLDLTTAAPPGRHALGVWLGDGWYRGRIGCDGGLWDVYGSDVSVLAQVEVAHDDGRVAVLPLTWRWAPSPITAAGLYEGETYDARLEQVGWSRPGFDDSAWATPTVLPRVSFPHVFEAPIGPGVEVIEALRPVAVERRPDGRVRLDFGQNTSGKIRISGVVAPAGHTLRLHHTEVLEADGTLGTRPLRSATAIDTYTFGEGNTPITWTPRFTIHGFRYAELEGWPEGFDPAEHVELLVVHSVMERSGHFASSHELLNEFHRNVVWGMRGNFVDLPTDCPQRDERLGWTGDIAVFAPAAVFLYNSTSFLLNWLRDVKAEQRADGTMRNYHPFVDWGFPPMPSAAWGDAAVLVPWALYRHTGRLDILADHVESMSAWIDQVDAITGHTGHWSSGFTLGDWLDPGAPPEQPSASLTDKYLVATAYYARSARLTAEAWRLLGDESQAARYGALATQALDAFRRNYVTPAGRLVSDTVTSYALAICFDLLTPEQFPVAGARLAELVADKDHTIASGFAAAHLVCDALVRTGSTDTAYHLLLQTKCPSWLYQVTMGATTVWERWDSMLSDGSINPGDMTSFNHYAYGTVADFLHRVVAGLAPGTPGYAQVEFAPRPGGGLTHAEASLQVPAGLIRSAWHREGEVFTLTVTVPPGHTGIVYLPDGSAPIKVGPGITEHTCPWRAASADPERPRKLDMSNPEDRAEFFRRQAEGTQPL